MKSVFFTLTIVGIFTTGISCSNLKVVPIQNEYGSIGKQINEGASGVRFYRPALHVWILRDNPPDNIGTVTDEKKVTDNNSDENLKDGKETISTTTTKRSILGDSYKLQIITLPDYTKEYIIQWKRGLIGSVNPKFTLTDGWNLTGFESEINTGVTAGLTLTGSVAEGGGSLKLQGNFKGPGLYKLNFDKATKIFTLGERVIALD